MPTWVCSKTKRSHDQTILDINLDGGYLETPKGVANQRLLASFVANNLLLATPPINTFINLCSSMYYFLLDWSATCQRIIKECKFYAHFVSHGLSFYLVLYVTYGDLWTFYSLFLHPIKATCNLLLSGSWICRIYLNIFPLLRNLFNSLPMLLKKMVTCVACVNWGLSSATILCHC